jgi:hypothetical protein
MQSNGFIAVVNVMAKGTKTQKYKVEVALSFSIDRRRFV